MPSPARRRPQRVDVGDQPGLPLGLPRRANGESTIARDRAGRWHGYVSMGLKSGGVRDRRHVSGSSRPAVVAKVRALERQRDAGTALAAGAPMTVAAWLDHWVDTVAPGRVRFSTLRWYRTVVARHLTPRIGHHRLDRLQPEHVEQLYRDLSATGLSPATVLQCHRVLSRALKVAMQRGRVARNVCALVDAPSIDRTEIEPLSADAARRVLEAAAGKRNAARWSVALALGLRQGEALGLRWRDIDMERNLLTVRTSLQRRGGNGLVLVEPKSRAGRRSIALPEPLVIDLRSHRQAQDSERQAAGELWTDHDFVFCQPNGKPIDPRADHRAWRSLLAEAGVPQARLHDARHTAATLLLQQGVHPRVAMQILGHSQIALTLGTYSHVVPELARDAADRMGNVLWNYRENPKATTLAPRQPQDEPL